MGTVRVMTMTETASPKKARNGNGDSSPALVDQFVLSTAGVASQSLTNARSVVEGVLATTDAIVLGLFDIADELAQARLLNDLAVRAVSIGRQAWSSANATAREALDRV
jgi:hypothetical protein